MIEERMDRAQTHTVSIAKGNDMKASRICAALQEALDARRPVQERAILDFCRLACRMLYDGLVNRASEVYATLSDKIENYWLYEAQDDNDKKRCLTYARLYQIVSIVRVFEREREQTTLISDLVQKNRKHKEVLRVIHDNPEITHKELSERLGISVSALSHRAADLEKQGLLDVRRFGNHKLYSLSHRGLSVYSQMNKKTQEEIWTGRRLQAMSELLRYMANSAGRYSGFYRDEVIDLLRGMDRWDDETVFEKTKQWHTNSNNSVSSEYDMSAVGLDKDQYILNKRNYEGIVDFRGISVYREELDYNWLQESQSHMQMNNKMDMLFDSVQTMTNTATVE